MNILTKKLQLSLVSTLILGSTLNASAGTPAEAAGVEEQSRLYEYLLTAQKAQGSLVFSPKASATCNSNLFNCTGSSASTSTILSCAADYFANGVPISACTTALQAAGGTCAQAVSSCNAGTSVLQNTRLPRAGSGIMQQNVDISSELTCPSPHRVRSVSSNWSTTIHTTRITMTCTNGQVLTFGYSGAPQGGATTCANPNLVNGLLLRTGSAINAVGTSCLRVASSNATPSQSGLNGSAGGTRTDRICSNGKFLVGARVYMDGENETDRNLLGIEVLCR